MLHVLTERGETYLVNDFKPKRLSWKEVKCLTGPDTVGLPIGYNEETETARKQLFISATSAEDHSRASLAGINGDPLKSSCFKLLEQARSEYETKQLPWSEDRLALGFPAAVQDKYNVEEGWGHSDVLLGLRTNKPRVILRADMILGTADQV